MIHLKTCIYLCLKFKSETTQIIHDNQNLLYNKVNKVKYTQKITTKKIYLCYYNYNSLKIITYLKKEKQFNGNNNAKKNVGIN